MFRSESYQQIKLSTDVVTLVYFEVLVENFILLNTSMIDSNLNLSEIARIPFIVKIYHSTSHDIIINPFIF